GGGRRSAPTGRGPRQDPQALLRDPDGHAAADLPPLRQRPERAPFLLRALSGELAARDLRLRGLPGQAAPSSPAAVPRAARAMKGWSHSGIWDRPSPCAKIGQLRACRDWGIPL